MSDGQVIESVLFLKPIGGDHSAIRRFFEEEQVLEHASRTPGFLGSKLHSPVSGGDLTMVTAQWESEDAYRRWVQDPWRAANAANSDAVYEAMEFVGGSM